MYLGGPLYLQRLLSTLSKFKIHLIGFITEEMLLSGRVLIEEALQNPIAQAVCQSYPYNSNIPSDLSLVGNVIERNTLG